MANRIRVEKIDDVDGTEGAETITFALDGERWDIDLSERNAKRLRKAFGEWTKHARKAGTRPRVVEERQAPTGPRTTLAADPKTVRAWANSNGFDLGPTGRVPADAVEAYRAAHPEEAV